VLHRVIIVRLIHRASDTSTPLVGVLADRSAAAATARGAALASDAGPGALTGGPSCRRALQEPTRWVAIPRAGHL
jgi:hypothetical protein